MGALYVMDSTGTWRQVQKAWTMDSTGTWTALARIWGQTAASGEPIWAKSYEDGTLTFPDKPLAATNLRVTATTSSGVSLAWDYGTSNQTGFLIQYSEDGSNFNSAGAVGPDARIATIDTLQQGVTYWLQVVAYATENQATTYADPSNVVQATTVLPAPSGLTATALSDTEIRLSWTDNSTGETGFIVYQSASVSGPWTEIDRVTGAPYTASGQSPSTPYSFELRSYRGSVESEVSNVASATTLPSQSAAPTDTPTITNFVANPGQTVTVSVKASLFTGENTVVEFWKNGARYSVTTLPSGTTTATSGGYAIGDQVYVIAYYQNTGGDGPSVQSQTITISS